MNRFRRTAFVRIGLVTVAMSALSAPLVWYVSRENAEAEVVAFAQEESHRVLANAHALDLSGPTAAAHADQAAQTLVGGLFEIVEIYDPAGLKLAEQLTSEGRALEHLLPKHVRPESLKPEYESLQLPDGRWVMRVMVPLALPGQTQRTGYFEGVRLVPDWQHRQIQSDALVAALMALLASLACGAAIYPVVIHLAGENERKALQVLESHIAMMEALGRAIAKRDSDTGTHNYRVAWMAATLGESLGLSGAAMQALIAGSFLHDVGKIGIPDAILLKPGRLDAAEMATMRTHVAQGEDIVDGAGWLEGAAEVVSCHHEKWDGSGYPQGLAGADIPLAARIFAVVDVYDALSSRRPYKEPMPFGQVMDILQEGRGQHFDPEVLDRFVALAPRVRDALEGQGEEAIKRLMTDMIERHFDTLVDEG
ncbi:MAG TPA: HD domain-containing phosphohydrolase [Burkholderiaceae bacterium]|nr:HD domain-containing phosphohydrolase [Burkholderiaceae bacterium]